MTIVFLLLVIAFGAYETRQLKGILSKPFHCLQTPKATSLGRYDLTMLQDGISDPKVPFKLYSLSAVPTSQAVRKSDRDFSPNSNESNDYNSIDDQKNGIVIIAGFEKFNFQLYKNAISKAKESFPGVEISIFTDTDIAERPEEVDAALVNCKALLCSLIFDYSTVLWIKNRIATKQIPVRFCFESALELMSETVVGEFNLSPPSDSVVDTSTQSSAANSSKKPKNKSTGGMPAPVKIILNNLFGTSSREEDKLAGYLKLLKIGPKLLNWIPGKVAGGGKLNGLKTWISVYAFWTESGIDNIASMLRIMIADLEFDVVPSMSIIMSDTSTGITHTVDAANSDVTLLETPPLGLFHPLLKEQGIVITSPREYVDWYTARHSWVDASTPRVGLLLYRKHVISEQGYIGNLITLMEAEGIMPIPVYINGVEGHTVVRDLFTSNYETKSSFTLNSDAVAVDAVVNTIGFPLVGGPAGSMEGGRGIDAAREILLAKNVPYIVAAPLLIQGLESWQTSGVQGLQTVVLYSLPELDGAVETIVLGGLVGDKIVILPERTRKLCSRVKSWVTLRKLSTSNRRLAMMIYGFPPNVGAVGTAALLNVGKSFERLFQSLEMEGYNLGETPAGLFDGDIVMKAMKYISNELVITRPVAVIQHEVDRLVAELQSDDYRKSDVKLTVGVHEVSYLELKSWLGKKMASSMEKQWGSLESFTGFGSGRSPGVFKIIGLQFGNLFLGVQPLLGIEGDPMRMMFERDLTPHPQYAAFYLWLKNVYNPHSMLHYGMHGTVEWLPGSSLGSTAESWPDILLGNAPNVYVYACNNPSESLLAKRRGYATIISHNVPPYSRSGLYKELQSLRDIINDYQSQRVVTSPKEKGKATADKELFRTSFSLIVDLMNKIGLTDDLPFQSKSQPLVLLTTESLDSFLARNIGAGSDSVLGEFIEEFDQYIDKLRSYLSELESRLFSEGLHIMGQEYTSDNIKSFLDAVLADSHVSSVPAPDGDLNREAHTLTGEVIDIIVSDTMRGKERSQIISNVYDCMRGTRTTSSDEQVEAIKGNIVQEFFDLRNSYLTASGSSGVYFSDLLSAEERFALSIIFQPEIVGYSSRLPLQDTLLERIGDAWNILRLKLSRDLMLSSTAASKLLDVMSLGMSTTLALSSSQAPRNIVKEAIELTEILLANPREELQSLINAIGGEYTAAAPGGDIIRDGIGVLPTGRNIYALDPYRIPSTVAMARGKAIADKLIADHLASTGGTYPQTISVNLWGLDTIKTKGESVGILLGLVGAEPVREMTGRIVAFRLIPLETLKRPRIDVLGTLSGIFRDSFGNVLDLLDDLFLEASYAVDEPTSLNFIKKHTETMSSKGIDRPHSRLFSNPPGDFGSMVNEQIGSSDWEKSEELGDIWQKRNSFSYGKAGEKGTSRSDVLVSLLNSTDRIVQEIDSVEYGLTDIQEYYANTGALKKAAENVRGPGSRVNVSIVESFSKDVKPRQLEDVLRLEYRSKLLNPKWSAAMLKQGAGGVYEISGRLTALIGWAGTTGFQDKWVFDGAAERYILDEEVASKMRAENPEAFRNIVKRMMEATGRGFWKPDKELLQKLQEMFDEIDDEMEMRI